MGQEPERRSGKDVSDDGRFASASLVDHPYREWRRGEPPETKYHLKRKESFADGFQRVVREQLEFAA